MSETPAIDLRKVEKIYYLGAEVRVHALRGISLKVYRGDFISIMGPSGSGKTTLLNIMGTMDRPTKGRVIVDGIDVTDMSEGRLAVIRREKIGFVFQAYNLITTLSALENVMLPMLLTGKYTEAEAKEKAMLLLELVGLEERAAHRPRELSGGEQQRVAIARALANDPAFVLMDEPTGSLDTVTGARVMSLVKLLNEHFGQTFIVVTHNPAVAKVAQKMFFIRDGLLYLSPPKELLEFRMSANAEDRIRLLDIQVRLLRNDILSLRRRFRSGDIPRETYLRMKRNIIRRLEYLRRLTGYEGL
ncbi:MAG: ABC transporter ATP-binding protein [Thermoprotei archaeon]|nr:ABC transporter ATP-binding protein [Thermoprotei archaeon]